jgi:uncharacterized protein YdhG (YjbR/CyaY superfamily)
MGKKKFKPCEEYFSSLPENIKSKMQELRSAIRQAAPQAEEVISYNMPAFKIHGRMLAWIAVHNNHIGFYPHAEAIKIFKKELANYKTSKGAIQFPIDKPIPKTLVKKMIKFRAKINNEKLKFVKAILLYI